MVLNMKLSGDEQQALEEHYKDKELYDPSTDPEQQTAYFKPQGLDCGGGVEGYAKGGTVIDLSNLGGTPGVMDNYSVGSRTDTAKGFSSPPSFAESLKINPEPKAPAMRDSVADNGPVFAAASPQTPAAIPDPTAPDRNAMSEAEYQELVANIRPGLGERVASGLGGFADAIMSSVARAPGPGFQRNIMESNQSRRSNLENALKLKYDAANRNTQIGLEAARAKEEMRRNNAMEDLARQSQASTIGQRNYEQAKESKAQKLKAGEDLAKLPATGILHPTTWGRGADIEGQRARLQAELSGSHPQDQQAIAWALANPSDPRSAKILKANGH